MFESLARIQNPFARSLTAAFTSLSVITLASSIVIGITESKNEVAYKAIGLTRPENESAYKVALYASLMGAGCGALFGLGYSQKGNRTKSTRALQDKPLAQSMAQATWKDWRSFVVVRKVKESEEITSFYLQPEDQGELPDFKPGQFLTIKLDIPGQSKPVIRTYSLSDYANPHEYYRLSIKREPTPRGLEVMPGIASNFMHDQIHEGSIIPAKPPSGKFVLEVNRSLPAVLISNGVGITPMISMAKALTRLNPSRPIQFIHGARDGRYHAFRDEILEISQRNPNLNLHFAYSRPRPEDAGKYDSTGYADTMLVRSLIEQEAEYFLCGSPSFMQSLRDGLKEAGVPEHRVFFEVFTAKRDVAVNKPLPKTEAEQTKTAEIVFARSGQTVAWDSGSESLLEFAEANGLNPDYSCRQGICGVCRCKIQEGEVDYQVDPTAEIEEGSVLICISKPKTSRIVLDL